MKIQRNSDQMSTSKLKIKPFIVMPVLGIVITLAAVVAHRFMPQRTLELKPNTEGAVYFLLDSDNSQQRATWLRQDKFHFICDFTKATSNPGCSFNYLLYSARADRGIDLSRYKKLSLRVTYNGNAKYLRVAVRNFDPRFAKLDDSNSSKFNSLNLTRDDLTHPLQVNMDEFRVPEWWISQYNLPRRLAYRDFSNATVFSIDLLGDIAGQRHEMQIDQIEFSGDWISAEYWYLGILCIWMAVGMGVVIAQLLAMRRKHQEQRSRITHLIERTAELSSEKEKYQRLSTIDALTKVLNRHGIELYLDAMRQKNQSASVIVIDIDHFKRINDQHGHHTGDRVLQTIGNVLSAHHRVSDGLGRWGGEEFVLVCPDASLTSAVELAEKLRRQIAETIVIPELSISVTASFGVATTSPDQSFSDVFVRADEALYLAKSRGRNCVVAASNEDMHTMTSARKGKWALISGRFKILK
jgi:diguanylate cyclase (GGDEF)-like protein